LSAFVASLCLSELSARWAAPLKKAVSNLRSVAQSKASASTSTDAGLEKLESMLQTAPSSGTLSQKLREDVLALSDELDAALPAPVVRRVQHEALRDCVLQQLLARAESMNALSRKKLENAGFIQLADFDGVSAAELENRAGLRPEQSQQMLELTSELYKRLRTKGPDSLDSGVGVLVRGEVEALRRAVADFRAACDEEDAERKRVTRSERDQRGLRITLLMAELGQFELAQELATLSAEDRMEKLERFATAHEG
jgi:hypothetical protein